MRARGDARLHLSDDLVEQQRGLRLVVTFGRGESRSKFPGNHGRDDLADGRGAQNLLRLSLELRLGESHREHDSEACQDVVFIELVVADLQPTCILLDLRADHLHEAGLEPLLVRAALRGSDDVHERAHRGLVAGPPPHRDVDLTRPLQLRRHHGPGCLQYRHGLGKGTRALQPPGVGDRGVRSEELRELRNPTVEAVLRRERRLGVTFVGDRDRQARYEEGRLPGPLL